MKSITKNTSLLAAFAVLLMSTTNVVAQDELSIDVRPQPLEATEFAFPEFSEFDTDNGIHVYVVENHAVPTITFSLMVKGGRCRRSTWQRRHRSHDG